MRSEERLERLTQTPELKMLGDANWRMSNLYFIKDQEGKRIRFRPNWAQQELSADEHPCKIILKARQLGITTYYCLKHLDNILWNDNMQAGIVAHTLDDASNLFQDKLKYAFDHLHPTIRSLFRPTGDSAKELSFSHGSAIRVGTSLRSSTLQYLHISEFGKVCAKNPEKAREIVTGSLNTIHAGQSMVIESTAEGREGFFYEMVQEARKPRPSLTNLDFKFFFFPWWKHPFYTMGVSVEISQDLKDYFAKLALGGIVLSEPQKWWYANKWKTQKEDILREFPSTPDEAFAASQEGYWYATYLKELYDSGHVTNVSYDRSLPVHTAWDLGQGDMTAIWFFQVTRSDDIRVIDFWMKNNTPLDQMAIMLKSKNYNYGTHMWPTDANARGRGGITFVDQARPLGLTGLVLEPHGFLQGINLVKTTLSRCWFDERKCMEGLKHLENYKKRWNANFGGWTSEPLHNDASHAADAFRYLCAGVDRIVGGTGSVEKDYSILRKFWGG